MSDTIDFTQQDYRYWIGKKNENRFAALKDKRYIKVCYIKETGTSFMFSDVYSRHKMVNFGEELVIDLFAFQSLNGFKRGFFRLIGVDLSVGEIRKFIPISDSEYQAVSTIR